MQTVDNNIFNPNEGQRNQLPAELFNILITSNIGPMLVNRHDRYVGGSLIHYGELCRGEATLFSHLLHPDDVVIEAGANIGAHTALLSKLVGEEGAVYAFEPQRIVFQTLCANLALNQCTNVIARQQGVGSAPGEMIVQTPDPRTNNNFGGLSLLTQGDGEAVAIVTIDSLRLPRCHLIKADVEGMEADVLAGAQETIQRCRPILYLENDRQEKAAELIAAVMALGYRLWWHIVPLFEPNNFARNKEDIFGGTVSVNMLCQPAELALPVADWPEITRPDDLWQITLPKPPAPAQVAMQQDACPICGGAAQALDTLNGSRSCEDRRGLTLPPADWSAEYFLCADCGFCYAPAFRDWTAEMFAEHVYNAAYPEVDPDYLTLRPQGNARRLIDAFGAFSDKRHLDYGGGHGAMSRLLREAGWSSVSCDPFHGDTKALAGNARFELITAFEVFEHDPEPHRLLDNLQQHLAEPGLVLFSTLLHDGHIAPGKPLDWWYAAPRNGHVSLYSRDSLRRLAQAHGLHCISLSPDLHAFWRVLPAWAETLIARPVANMIERLSPLPDTATPASANEMANDMASEAACLARLAANPADHAALHMLGLFAFAADDPPLAIERLEAAIAIDETVAAYHSDLGELYRLAGQPEKSALAGRRAVALAPDSADAHYRLGLACDDGGHRAEALACYRRATQLDPQHLLGWYYLGQGLAEQGDVAPAIDALTHAVNLAPDHAEAQHVLGLLLRDRGECAAARHRFEMALRARPDYVAAHAHLAPLKTYKKDDPHFAVLTDLHARRADMHDQTRALCCFAYAKMCEDTGDDEAAFAAYAESNRIKAALRPFDEAREEARTAATLRLFDRNFIAARQRPAAVATAAAGPTPIFIVGMPHAGAGWLERMLTRHPLAGAAHVDFSKLLADAAQPFPDLAATLDAAAWRALGERYLQLAAQQAPGKAFVIDRNPENVRYLGLIHLALPQARIVHVMRDPLDSCFSCYAGNAEPDIGYSHDLGLLGRQYVRYINLMRHWHAVLPPRTIADVHYEDMTRETEQQMRRVVGFADLPWTDLCLQPSPRIKNQRDPLSARWHNFAQYLEPLYASVKRYRQEDGSNNPLAEALHNTLLSKANRLYREDRFAEALMHYDQALVIRPDDASALVNKGIVLRDLRRLDESIACFGAALAIAPEMSIARFNLASLQLKTGDWQFGWENYETRWRGNDQAQKGVLKPPPALCPQWNGEADTERQNLLVFTEQGAGDNIHFARYLTLASQRFASVGFVCPQPLWRLMEWSFGDRLTLLTTQPKSAEIWNWQCPLMSLPRAFQTQLDSIPATIPYLKIPRAAQAYWRARLNTDHATRRPRIGISWAGNKSYLYDKRRSLAFGQLHALWSVPDITWVNLQVRMSNDQPPPVPDGIDWIDWTMELADFADTAALVANLDLVISIDSAIAHLAGALGRPTWLLNRFESEWRWLLNREDSPWYPTMRIFNQPNFGDWESVLHSIAAALQEIAKHDPEHGR